MSEQGFAAEEGTSAEQVTFPPERARALLLLASVFVIAGCGLIYELIAGALSAYLLGNATAQFSVVIGLFLSAMGLGSFLSRFIDKQLIRRFLLIEILVGICGGLLPLVLFFSFAALSTYLPLLILMCVGVGTLVGLEIPLLVRILRDQLPLKAALGNVLSIDYLGALVASLLFPFVLLPHLGLVRTGALFGLLNVGVALFGMHVFRRQIRRVGSLYALAAVAAIILLTAFAGGGRATQLLEDLLYDDEIIYAEDTQYQRMVITRFREDLRLYLDGNIQFSSADEFRYHEALVHPALGTLREPQRVLLLGGGDGLAAREVFRHPSVEHVDLVDLDPAVTRLFSSHPRLVALNEGSLSDARLRVINEDAFSFLEHSRDSYDAILIDLPDPNDESLGKLYTTSFYRLVLQHLSVEGVFVTQSTSPYFSPDAFWSIVATIEASSENSAARSPRVVPYHVDVPSFGDWGFVLAGRHLRTPVEPRLPGGLRFLDEATQAALFIFPKDTARRERPVNQLGSQQLVHLYRQGWERTNP